MQKKETRRRGNGKLRTVLYVIIAECIYSVIMGTLIYFHFSNCKCDEVILQDMRLAQNDLELVGKAPIVIVEDNNVEAEIEETTSEEEIAYTTESQTEQLATETETSEVEEAELVYVPTLKDITFDSNTTERVNAIMNFLIDEGFTPEAAAGVVGNIAVESSFNPNIVSTRGYYGMFQWNTSEAGGYWWYAVEKWLQENGYEWNSFEGQITAFLYCPNRGLLNDNRLEELKVLTDVEQAAELVAVYYESCVGGSDLTCYYRIGNCYQDLYTRKSEAWIAYNMYITGDEYYGVKNYVSTS